MLGFAVSLSLARRPDVFGPNTTKAATQYRQHTRGVAAPSFALATLFARPIVRPLGQTSQKRTVNRKRCPTRMRGCLKSAAIKCLAHFTRARPREKRVREREREALCASGSLRNTLGLIYRPVIESQRGQQSRYQIKSSAPLPGIECEKCARCAISIAPFVLFKTKIDFLSV